MKREGLERRLKRLLVTGTVILSSLGEVGCSTINYGKVKDTIVYNEHGDPTCHRTYCTKVEEVIRDRTHLLSCLEEETKIVDNSRCDITFLLYQDPITKVWYECKLDIGYPTNHPCQERVAQYYAKSGKRSLELIVIKEPTMSIGRTRSDGGGYHGNSGPGGY